MEFTGNATVAATISVNTKAFKADGSTTTVTDSGDRVAATFDLFYEDDPHTLGASITAAAAAAGVVMTCIAARVTGGDRSAADGGWTDTLNLELLCCPSALT